MNFTCQDCGNSCDEWELLNTPDPEVWCYCEECNTETFHKL